MANNWSQLVGEVVDAKYVLQVMERQQNDRAVFVAEEAGDGSHLLVEVVAADSTDFESQQRRWSIASDLHHDHLARIYSSGVVSLNGEKVLYCARERHDECLADVLAARTLDQTEASPVLQSVLSCLEYLHGRRLAHGNIQPDQVLAIGDRIKLSSDAITSAAGAPQEDMYGVGELITQMFGGEKGPRPLREIAEGCLRQDPDQRLTADQALQMLSPRAVPQAASPQPVPKQTPSSKSRIVIAAGLAVAAVLAAATFLRSRPVEKVDVTPAPVAEDRRPSPVATADPAPVDRSRSAAPKPIVKEVAPARSKALPEDTVGNWAVIAATYRDYDAAERRATSIGRQFRECNCSVFPERGKGAKYYVVLGSGLTREAADRVRQRAANSGAPADAYVTKLNAEVVRSRTNDEAR